jgi:predicted acylesterase/phospholipase RssA
MPRDPQTAPKAMRKLTIGLFSMTAAASFFRAAAPAAEARPQGPHRIALVLSGGGARGAANIGVLNIAQFSEVRRDPL